LLPGIVLPAELAYPALIEALGEGVEARAKELEVYAGDQPGPDYGFETELAGIMREAEVAGFERFHLVGYSGGGAISAAFAARYPDCLLSLALLEPAWVGNEGRSERELRVQAEFDRTWELPEEKLMRRFVELQLAPGVEPPPPPPGPTPPWMVKRPAGIRALTAAFASCWLDLEALGAFPRPVYYALGGRSNPTTSERWRSGSGVCSATIRWMSSRSATTSTPRTGPSPSGSRPGCSRSGSGCRPIRGCGSSPYPPRGNRPRKKDAMGAFHLEIIVVRPSEDVFAFIADPTNMPLWYDAVERVTKTSAGPATSALIRPPPARELRQAAG
jgi:hypothetical protein